VRSIAVVNQKGGCGKTTTSVNLAAFLARAGRRTLVVDLDPQGHATLGLLREAPPTPATVADVFLAPEGSRQQRLLEIARPALDDLDIVPADVRLSGVPESLAGRAGRERILSEALAGLGRYDYVVIDCPPAVGTLTFNALLACDEAIVPVDPGFYSLHGLGKLLETFAVLAAETGHQIAPQALITMYSGRTRFARSVADEIRQHLAGRHFQTIVRHSVKLAEAASHGLPIALYCRTCAGFADYHALTQEVLQAESSGPRPAAPAHGDRSAFETAASSGPIITDEGVIFAFRAPGAQRVHLVGDFNQWLVEGGNEMTFDGSTWKRVLKLRPGRYRYRYVVDGAWCSDPVNAQAEPAPFGGHNSVFVVADSQSSEGAN